MAEHTYGIEVVEGILMVNPVVMARYELKPKVLQKLKEAQPRAMLERVKWKGEKLDVLAQKLITICTRRVLDKCHVTCESKKHQDRVKVLLEDAKLFPELEMSLDNDAKNVAESTVWVRYKETKEMRDWVEKDLQKRVTRVRESSNALSHKQITQKTLSEEMGDLIPRAKVSLLDPISKLRIKIPVIGFDCTHGGSQFFDLEWHIRNNHYRKGSLNNSWECPFCNKSAKRLINLNFWEECLNHSSTQNLEEVEVLNNGTWQVPSRGQAICLSDDESPRPGKRRQNKQRKDGKHVFKVRPTSAPKSPHRSAAVLVGRDWTKRGRSRSSSVSLGEERKKRHKISDGGEVHKTRRKPPTGRQESSITLESRSKRRRSLSPDERKVPFWDRSAIPRSMTRSEHQQICIHGDDDIPLANELNKNKVRNKPAEIGSQPVSLSGTSRTVKTPLLIDPDSPGVYSKRSDRRPVEVRISERPRSRGNDIIPL